MVGRELSRAEVLRAQLMQCTRARRLAAGFAIMRLDRAPSGVTVFVIDRTAAQRPLSQPRERDMDAGSLRNPSRRTAWLPSPREAASID